MVADSEFGRQHNSGVKTVVADSEFGRQHTAINIVTHWFQ